MGAGRTIATKLLGAVVRLVPNESRDWAEGALRELDFIKGDWAALFWALGSVTAILRHAMSAWSAWLHKKENKEAGMSNIGKKAGVVGLGVLSAVALLGCLAAGLRMVSILFPGSGLDHSSWGTWLAVMAIPETVFVAATVLLWRKKGPVAAGVLALGLAVALHVGVHLALR